MKFILSLAFSLSLFLFCNPIKAQTIIHHSTEIEQNNSGKSFYIHHVQKGETLYAIAKAYEVAVDSIVKYNPGVNIKIEIGQRIRIPKNRTKVKVLVEKKPVAPEGFIYYQVKKGETLYRIMLNHQIKLDELKKYNENLSTNIRPGQWILIPTQEKRIADKAAARYDSVVFYTLKRRDNFYRLQKKFKVNQQQLEQLNPGLKTTGLQKGLKIIVPFIRRDISVPAYHPIALDTVVASDFEVMTEETKSINCHRIKFNRQVYKIGFMVPLFSNLEPEIRVESDYLIHDIDSYKSFRFIEFVEGAKLALDSLAKLGFKAEVYIWDTQASRAKVDSICKLPEFKNLDLLIGPFYSKNTAIVRKAADENNINLVDLFSKTYILADTLCQNFIVKSSEQTAYNALAKYIADSIPNYNISILHQGNDDELKRLAELKSALYNPQLGIDTNRIKVYTYQQKGLDKIIKSLDAQGENIIFNLVDNEARVANFIRQMNILKKDNAIMIMALDKYWSRYKTLELGYLNNLNYTFATDYFIDDYDTTAVTHFNEEFYQQYHRMPNKLAYLAYDISWYFGNALYYYGSNFATCLPAMKLKTLHSPIMMKRQRQGVYRNIKTNVIQYDNYHKLRKE